MNVAIRVKHFVQRARFAAMGAVFAVSLAAASGALVLQAQPAAADTACATQDKYPYTNVIYCGLSGSSISDYISSFKAYYDANSDAHAGNPKTHTDLQNVYNDEGASASLVNAMSTSNTFLATSHSDGTITLDSTGQVVAKNMNIAGRWVENGVPGFTHVVDDVYMRSYSVYFAPTSTVPTLVHINPTTGLADFALWQPCGNVITFTPVAPPKSLSCDSITPKEIGTSDTTLTYSFTAKASEQNTPITSYLFNFGDGTTENTSSATSKDHAYQRTAVQQTVTAWVKINGTVGGSGSCATPIIIPPVELHPLLSCSSLNGTAQDSDKTQYVFTAVADNEHTTITGYTFTFTDTANNSIVTKTVATGDANTVLNYTFPHPGTYHTQVAVTGPLGTFTQGACQTDVTVPTPPTPPALVNTGPGQVIALFGLTAVAGALFRHLTLRRRLLA